MSSGVEYSVARTAKKCVVASVLSLLPAVFGAVCAAVAAPDVAVTLGHQWPALPVAAVVGFLVGINNWLKNRGK